VKAGRVVGESGGTLDADCPAGKGVLEWSLCWRCYLDHGRDGKRKGLDELLGKIATGVAFAFLITSLALTLYRG